MNKKNVIYEAGECERIINIPFETGIFFGKYALVIRNNSNYGRNKNLEIITDSREEGKSLW